jgi:hypothetical protein
MPLRFKPGPPITREDLIKMGAKPFDPKDFDFKLSPKDREIHRRAVNERLMEDGKEPLFKD